MKRTNNLAEIKKKSNLSVLIIGAGINGRGTFRELALQGIDCLLIHRDDFCSGASMFIRRKFSASNFLSEIRESGSTCFIYIGELCRYLVNTPARDDDYRNPLCTVMGNGLRPDIWHQFKDRFGIQRIAEFYGSSEGNIGFLNLLNFDNCQLSSAID